MSDAKQGTPLKTIVKYVNVACACVIVAITILDIISLQFVAFWNWIFMVYQFLFALMILAAEFRLDFILKYFRFLEGNIGKGWFLIFCGMWLIGQNLESTITGIIFSYLRELFDWLWSRDNFYPLLQQWMIELNAFVIKLYYKIMLILWVYGKECFSAFKTGILRIQMIDAENSINALFFIIKIINQEK